MDIVEWLRESFMLIEVVRWYGALIFLVAYLLLVTKVLKAEHRLFHFLNLTGAVSLGISSLAKNDFQIVVLELVFGIITAYATIWPPRGKKKEV